MARLALLVVLALATPFARADVIVVDAAGGGDHSTLTAAVAAAASGDTLLVRDGVYAEPGPVVIDGKALTIAGSWSASVYTLPVRVQPGLVVRNLPPADYVVIENLDLLGTPGTATDPPTPALTLRDNTSHVRLQGCWLRGGAGGDNAHPHGVAAVDSADSISTALVGCLVQGGDGRFSPDLATVAGDAGPGITLSNGEILLYQSFVDGGLGGGNVIGGWPQGGAGGAGIEHANGNLLLVGSELRGGDGGTAHNGGDGGDGVRMGSAGFAWFMGGAFSSGGSGGWSDDGPDGSDGLPLVDPSGLATQFGGAQRTFDVTSPLREGEAGTLQFGGSVGDVTVLFASLSLHQIPFPGYQGVFMVAPAALLGPFVFAPPGNAVVPFVGPSLGAGLLESLDVHVQPAYVDGADVVFGPGRVLTLVDAAF